MSEIPKEIVSLVKPVLEKSFLNPDEFAESFATKLQKILKEEYKARSPEYKKLSARLGADFFKLSMSKETFEAFEQQISELLADVNDRVRFYILSYLMISPKKHYSDKRLFNKFLTFYSDDLGKNQIVDFVKCLVNSLKVYPIAYIDFVTFITQEHPADWINLDDLNEKFSDAFYQRYEDFLSVPARPMEASASRELIERKPDITLYMAIRRRLPQLLRITRPDDRAQLEALGINTELLWAWYKDSLKIDGASPSSGTGKPELSSAFLDKSEAECGYLHRIVKNGQFFSVDLFNGEPLACLGSCLAFGRTAYVFEGNLPYMLVSSGPWSSLQGVYIPSLNLSISFDAGSSSAITTDLPTLLVSLSQTVARANQNKLATEKYYIPAETQRKPIKIIVGQTENFAHHLWNFYSFLDKLALSKDFSKINEICFSGTEFFGPLQEIFHEIPAELFSNPRRNNVFSSFESGCGLVIPTGGFLISKTLIERIVKRARQRLNAVYLKQIETHASCYPVVLFSLRFGDKSWVDQVPGIIEICRALARQYESPLFIIDGFTKPVGVDYATGGWASTIKKLERAAQEITATLDPKYFVNLVGQGFDQFVGYSQLVDTYCVPYGSAQHKIGWFTKSPGVCYVPPHFNEKRRLISPACSACDFSSVPYFIEGTPVGSGSARQLDYKSRRSNFSNIEVSHEILLDGINEMLALGIGRALG